MPDPGGPGGERDRRWPPVIRSLMGGRRVRGVWARRGAAGPGPGPAEAVDRDTGGRGAGPSAGRRPGSARERPGPHRSSRPGPPSGRAVPTAGRAGRWSAGRRHGGRSPHPARRAVPRIPPSRLRPRGPPCRAERRGRSPDARPARAVPEARTHGAREAAPRVASPSGPGARVLCAGGLGVWVPCAGGSRVPGACVGRSGRSCCGCPRSLARRSAGRPSTRAAERATRLGGQRATGSSPPRGWEISSGPEHTERHSVDR